MSETTPTLPTAEEIETAVELLRVEVYQHEAKLRLAAHVEMIATVVREYQSYEQLRDAAQARHEAALAQEAAEQAAARAMTVSVQAEEDPKQRALVDHTTLLTRDRDVLLGEVGELEAKKAALLADVEALKAKHL